MKPCDQALLVGENPFADPVARLEGARPSPHVESLHAAVRRELRRAIDSVSSSGAAQMVLVIGEAGQGKTHELGRLRAEARSYFFVDVPPLKDAGAPFQHVLRYVVHGLAGQRIPFLWEALRQVAAAVREAAAVEGDEGLRGRIDEVLPPGSQYVNTFRAMLREDPELAAAIAQRGRVDGPLADVDPDFARVLCRIPERDLEGLALDWLRGAELPDEELRRLGVKQPLESEAHCFEVLRALAKVSPRPLVLCFDQIEAVHDLLGTAGVATLFAALMELYQQLPVCVVMMCQAQVWGQLAGLAQQPFLERLRRLPPLAKPSRGEAVHLVAARLERLWGERGVQPPYPSYPFSPAYLGRFVDQVAPSVRQVLARCGTLIDEMRRRGAVAEPKDGPAPAPAAPKDPVQALDGEHRRKLRQVEERADLATAKLRQEPLRNGLGHLLQGAVEQGRAVGGARVIAVDVPPKPKDGPRPPLIVTVEGSGGRARVALEVHSEEPQGAWRALARLHDRVHRGAADVGVMLREAEAPIGDGAQKTMALIHGLEPRGGLVYLERDQAHRLVAAELLLDAASASEVWLGDRPAGRDETLRFLLEHDDLERTLGPALSRVWLAAPPRLAPPPAGLGEQILGLLKRDAATVPLPRLAAELGLEVGALEPAIEALERAGRVRVAVDRNGVKIVLLATPPGLPS